eukprot:maker-scaffold2448_size15613-snap-gene-0.0 protein:Tk00885 transcript:maker-scaffold2448_size15613-snap-gene-0.0-mRNA-1 annotation:"uracil-dna glycosylase"
MAAQVKIEESWKQLLAAEFKQDYFAEIKTAILKSKDAGTKVYPPSQLIFNAFNMTPVPDVKVVILGQDPYHRPGQAMGLSFSVPRNITTPPSLRNIYKEMNRDIDFEVPTHGDLTPWTQQGVLLLNACLTVEKGQPASHSKIGWQDFTDAVIKKLSDKSEHIVFMLWGNFAKSKAPLINSGKHLILEAAHPSPLARNKFQGCAHFSKANEIGWQDFTDAVIKKLSDKSEHIVFMLWGNFAKSKAPLINSGKHLILEAAHPSPLARNKFQGCAHFSKANAYLKANGREPIDWSLAQ